MKIPLVSFLILEVIAAFYGEDATLRRKTVVQRRASSDEGRAVRRPKIQVIAPEAYQPEQQPKQQTSYTAPDPKQLYDFDDWAGWDEF